MNWSDFALNPKAMTTLYDKVPSLNAVYFHSYRFEITRYRVETVFDMPRFVGYPPAKWHKEFNTVQLTINFWGVTDLICSGWMSPELVDIAIASKEDQRLEFLVSDPQNLHFQFSFDSFRIDRISGYHNLKPNVGT